MNLVNALFADAQGIANSGEGLRRIAIKTMVSDYDLSLARGKLVDKFTQCHRYLSPIELFDYVITVGR